MAAAMMESLSGQIGTSIVTTLFPVSVVSVDGDQVVLSQGGDTVQAGQRWQAVRLGEELKDPQTGRSLGRSEHRAAPSASTASLHRPHTAPSKTASTRCAAVSVRARSNCARSWAASRRPPQERLPRPLRSCRTPPKPKPAAAPAEDPNW